MTGRLSAGIAARVTEAEKIPVSKERVRRLRLNFFEKGWLRDVIEEKD